MSMLDTKKCEYEREKGVNIIIFIFIKVRVYEIFCFIPNL